MITSREKQVVDARGLADLVETSLARRPATQRLQERIASKDQIDSRAHCYPLGYGLILTKDGIREGYLGGGGWSYSYNSPVGYGHYKVPGTARQITSRLQQEIDAIDRDSDQFETQNAGSSVALSFTKSLYFILINLSKKIIRQNVRQTLDKTLAD